MDYSALVAAVIAAFLAIVKVLQLAGVIRSTEPAPVPVTILPTPLPNTSPETPTTIDALIISPSRPAPATIVQFIFSLLEDGQLTIADIPKVITFIRGIGLHPDTALTDGHRLKVIEFLASHKGR